MKSIKEKAKEYAKDYSVGYTQKTFEAGVNYALDAIEEFISKANLGNNAVEKFYKSDIMADIHKFIEQLKK